MEQRQVIENRAERLMMVFTEPEAQDYWLRPGEKLEVRAEISISESVFEICLHEDGVVVFPTSDMGYISAWKDGLELECGHQRPDGWCN